MKQVFKDFEISVDNGKIICQSLVNPVEVSYHEIDESAETEGEALQMFIEHLQETQEELDKAILGVKWGYIVEEAKDPNTILEHEVRNLILFADEQATDSDKNNFVRWAEDGMDINTSLTSPGEHFACAENMRWEDF